jgi:hypothetical protein
VLGGSGGHSRVLGRADVVPAPGAARLGPAGAARASPPVALSDRLGALRSALGPYGRSAPGEWGIAIAPLGEGPVTTIGTLQEGRAWSAIKIALLVAFLNWRRETSGPAASARLTVDERRDADFAIRRSDNLAARALYRRMAGGLGVAGARARLQQVFVDAGDARTTVASSLNPETGLTEFGTTRWTLADAVGLLRRLGRGCLLTRADNTYVLGLMRTIRGRRHRWGVPLAFPPAVPIAFKAGWGPEPDLRWLVEQVAIIGEGRGAYVLGIMVRSDWRAETEADPAAYYAGRRFVRSVATVVADTVGETTVGPAQPGCSRGGS